MKENGASERHQNNNLKAILAFLDNNYSDYYSDVDTETNMTIK